MQLQLATLVRGFIVCALALFASARAQEIGKPAQTEVITPGQLPVLSQVRGSEVDFLKWFETLVTGLGNGFAEFGEQRSLKANVQESVERFLYVKNDPNFIKLNSTDLPDQIALKIMLKKIVPRINLCRSVSQGTESKKFFATQQANCLAAIKADNFDISFVSVSHFHPNEIERRNGAIGSSTYVIQVRFDPYRRFILADSSWTPWKEKFDGGRLSIRLQEVSQPSDRLPGLPPYVIDVKDELSFTNFDASLLPDEPPILNATPLIMRIKHLMLDEQISLLTDLSEKNDPEAISLLAEHYRTGTGVEQNFSKATQLYERLAATDATIFTKLAIWFWNGDLGPRNPEKTARYLEKAVLAGDTTAMWDHAICLYRGIGCSPDVAGANRLFAEFAKNGDSRAQHVLGKELVESEPQDIDASIRLLSLAVEKDPWAEFPLALAYTYQLKQQCRQTWEFLTNNRDIEQSMPSELRTQLYQSMCEHFTKAVKIFDRRAYPYYTFLVATNREEAWPYAFAVCKGGFYERLSYSKHGSSLANLPWFVRYPRMDGVLWPYLNAASATNLLRLSFDDSRDERYNPVDKCPEALVLTTSQIEHPGDKSEQRQPLSKPLWRPPSALPIALKSINQGGPSGLVLIYFNDIDDSPFEIQMFRNSTFVDYVEHNRVLVIKEIRPQGLPPTPLQQQYGVTTLPAVRVLGSRGQELGRPSVSEGGPEPLISALEDCKRANAANEARLLQEEVEKERLSRPPRRSGGSFR